MSFGKISSSFDEMDYASILKESVNHVWLLPRLCYRNHCGTERDRHQSWHEIR